MDSTLKTNKNPLVSVVMPVYNCEAYIKESITSILNQTYKNFELFIIDDASTDNTVAIINKLKDDRIILIKKERNSGYTDSLNLGLVKSSGEYIARMDGDDLSLPDRFQKQVSFLLENPEVVACGTRALIIGTEKVIKHPELHEDICIQLLFNSAIIHPSVMFRRNFLVDQSLTYNREMEPAEDYDLWTRIAPIGGLANLHDTLLHYRIHTSQVSSQRLRQQQENFIKSRFEYLVNLGFTFQTTAATPVLDPSKSSNDIQKLDSLFRFLNLLIVQNSRKKIFNQQKLLLEIKGQKEIAVNYFLGEKLNYTIANLGRLLSSVDVIKSLGLYSLAKFIVKSFIGSFSPARTNKD